ncbi:type II toxin-antitoxin system RelE/ParE family toxin [Kordia jejudonensis]|uniref:type II toxin-antitoxin system RelE/ParE family toxin n=1 Tax=Kordia jejudonensis TaxID=1348245 RepID=UPI0006296222|nr:hypothetical protein [Kordia jejudonensis]
MTVKKIQVVWSTQAKTDLQDIFNWVKEKTTSVHLASNVVNDIIKSSNHIIFTDQYQVEEFLGEPFRRIIVRHYKLICKAESKTIGYRNQKKKLERIKNQLEVAI